MLALVAVLGYLMGSFSSAYLIGKISGNIDIRYHGSGNSGTTNALRVLGKKAALITFICDFFKGIVASKIGYILLGDIGQVTAGLFAVVGHNWPLFLGFKGGKGVATSFGVLSSFSFSLSLISAFIGLGVALISNYVSLGSLTFLLSFPILYSMVKGISDEKFQVFILALIFFIMSSIRHKENIKRLLNGTENKFRK